MSELEQAKKVIIDHLDEILTVKTTKWVYEIKNDIGKYVEVDAGYSKEELDLMQSLEYRDNKDLYKLRDLLEEWI